MDLRSDVRGWIESFIDDYCQSHDEEPIWREPLVGLADTASPEFARIREIGNERQKLPSDYLDGAVTVISYFLPFKEAVSEDNEGGEFATPLWAHAYELTNTMAAELCLKGLIFAARIRSGRWMRSAAAICVNGFSER